VRRALQPANIFVSGEVDVVYKLGDLGLATLNHDARDVIEGDSKYLPRELLLEDFSALPMADIYSLGATVLEMALGRALPGSGPEWQQIRDGHLPMDELHGWPEELKSVLRWMMHPQPSQRPTAAELLRHPLFRSEIETLLQRERALTSGLQEKLQQVMQAKVGVCKLKRTITV
jgi:wee1-like protein kinase